MNILKVDLSRIQAKKFVVDVPLAEEELQENLDLKEVGKRAPELTVDEAALAARTELNQEINPRYDQLEHKDVPFSEEEQKRIDKWNRRIAIADIRRGLICAAVAAGFGKFEADSVPALLEFATTLAKATYELEISEIEKY